MHSFLPLDLVSFLDTQRTFNTDHEKLECGLVEFFSVEELRIGYVYVAPQGVKDPNCNNEGVYKVTAISLVKTCERYSPHNLIVYLPFENAFAMHDCDHAKITVFKDVSWSDITKTPERYLNSLWEETPRVPVLTDFAPWDRYEFWENHVS